ncbi:MAG: helix-turn-helix transcriptional regulator [Thermoplasmata archaeon]|nr:helix-turn-helix transcriptional regulator [Thermoplasmata archaeon]
MKFEITVVSNSPLSGESDKGIVTKTFLEQIGYLTKGSDPDIPLKLFLDCFIARADKAWLVEELAVKLDTSHPTIYRHLNKLKSMDLLEEVKIEEEIKVKSKKKQIQVKKGYKIRYGNLSKAWNFVEAHINVATENYRMTVDHLQKLIEKDRKK